MSDQALGGPSVAAGVLLGGRYRLTALLPPAATGHAVAVSCWQAHDDVLGRTVSVHVLEEPGPAATEQFLTSASTAGRMSHPGLARVYDAATESVVSAGTVTYQVGEWVDGASLSSLLADGPLLPRYACAVVGELADALSAAHDAGVVHGGVHPGNVRLTGSGRAVLIETGAGGGVTSTADSDVTGLAATLYAALTTRWPLTQPAAEEIGLTPAPRRDSGEPCTPREVRAGVPRDVDLLVRRVLLAESAAAPAITDAGAMAAALWPLAGSPDPDADSGLPLDPGADSAGVAPAMRRPRVWLLALGVVLAVLVGLVGYAVARSAHSSGHQSPPPFLQTVHPATGTLTPVHALSVVSYNPGQAPEHPELAALADDGNPTTFWHTETYATAKLGNLKPGTGLLFDLGSPVALRQVDITLVQTGEAVQLRASDTVGASAADFTLVRSLTPAGLQNTLSLNITARYWLVWITLLPPAPGGGYRGDVAEVRFLR